MTRRDIKEAQDFLMESQLIANDIETDPKHGFMTVNGYCGILKSGEVRSFVFPMYLGKSHMSGSPAELPAMFEVMERVNASGIPFTLHNGPYDLTWQMRYQLPVANYAYDSMTMFWAKYPELPKDLAFVSSILLDDYRYWKGERKDDNPYHYWEYNGKDVDRTLRNTIVLIDMAIDDSRMRKNFIDAHMRVLLVLGMSMKGMAVDYDRIEYHRKMLEEAAESKLAELRYLVADPDFNPNSPQQKKSLIYEKLGVRYRNEKGKFVSKLEDASTGAVPMRAMRADHPIFKRVGNAIMEAMEPAKQISNVIGIKKAWGRVYTSYNGVGTTTTRLSSSETPLSIGTNLQNLRDLYRDWIVAEPDSVLVDIDLSAGDDVFVTFESGDPHKIELFRSGRDTHSANATLFFPNWEYDAIVSGKKAGDRRITHPITGIRQITKKLSHGCNYLMAGLTLLMTAGREAIVAAAKEVGYQDAGTWSQERLVEFCLGRESLYRNHYTRFKRTGPDSWYTDLRTEFMATGGFTTPFNYFQRFLGDASDDRVLRALAATAGQAGTAGRINMAMLELTWGIIPPRFRDAPNPDSGQVGLYVNEREHGCSLRLQTHDSLTFNVQLTHPNWREGIRRIFTVMRRPVVIQNKLTRLPEVFRVNIESGVGYRWGKAMEDIKGSDLEGFEKALPAALEKHPQGLQLQKAVL
jgi:hypothetical protein